MAITSFIQNIQTVALNAVPAAGTAVATLVIPVATTSYTDIFIVGDFQGTSSYFQQMSAVVAVSAAGATIFPTAKIGSTNPTTNLTTNAVSSGNFNQGSTVSSATATVTAGGNLNITVTNADSTATNDFIVHFISGWVKNT